jgi:hypothetical protein
MFTRLDDILYPSKVEVVHFNDHNKYIYPIFKNGSTSIKQRQEREGYSSVVNDQIKKLTDIDVFLRNPKERYRSGFQTFLYNNSELDYQTIFQLGQQGYIFDRHYLPQINWLLNLMRYMDSSAKIHIHHLDMLVHYAGRNKLDPLKSDLEVPMSPWMEMALRLDWILWNNMSGQGWTPREILTKLAEDDTIAYSTIFKGKSVANVLP